MAFKLRPYQQQAVDQIINHLDGYQDSAPILVAPCAAGKSVMLSALCDVFAKRTNGMILVLTHRQELVEQNHLKLPQRMNAGIYSAGLGKKQLHKITIAGFQSIRNKASILPRVSYIMIDECDYALRGYKEFIEAVKDRSPALRVIGMTATPYDGTANRTALHLMPLDKAIFTGVGAEVQIGKLLAKGYLTPLQPYNADTQISTEGVKVDAKTGDFAKGALQEAVDKDDINENVAREIVDIFDHRNAVMVFCAGVDHAIHLCASLRKIGQSAEVVIGSTSKSERAKLIKQFKEGDLKYLVGVDVLLVGFDAPIMDGIAMLRPTLSARVYVQALGRGMRLYDGKTDCLVADFVGNADRHGPIDEIEGNPPKTRSGEAPVKTCDKCFSVILAGLKVCPVCGYEFIFVSKENENDYDANTGMLMSGVIKNNDGSRTYPVHHVRYEIRNTKAGAPALVARYFSRGRVKPVAVSYYNMFHHNASVARRDGSVWLKRQRNAGGTIPLTAEDALAKADAGALKVPSTVTIKSGSSFPIRFGAAKET